MFQYPSVNRPVIAVAPSLAGKAPNGSVGINSTINEPATRFEKLITAKFSISDVPTGNK